MQTFADTRENVLTEAQNAAIYTTDRSIAVVAGAGSGKTTVLISRCLHIIGGDWTEIDRLLAITFTEKAAGELRARLRPHMPAADRYRLEGAWIGTFHSCCARILRQHAPLMGLDPAFEILDENASNLLTSQSVRNALLSLLANEDEAANFLVDAIDFRAAIGALEDLMAFRWHAGKALANPKTDDEEEKKILRALSRVYAESEKNLIAQFTRLGSLDFQALEISALELLNKHPAVLNSYRGRFRHVLVDEFQDTNDIQTEFVLKIFEPTMNRLCIVGDPRQSIYRFRGANIDCFAKALGVIKRNKGESIDLKENFRSTPDIVSFVNSAQGVLADGLFGGLAEGSITAKAEEMKPARVDLPSGPSLIHIPIELPLKTGADDRRYVEAEAIAKFILDLTSLGRYGWGDIVCLFQALTGVAPYEKVFRIARIPYLIFGGRGLLERQEIADLIAVLSYAADPEDEIALLGLLRSPLICLSDDDLALLAGPGGKDLIENARRDPRCKLLRELTSMSQHLRPSEILRRAISMTGFEQICERLDGSGGMTANIDRFISLTSSIERQEPTPLKDFSQFIGELKSRSARIGDPPAAGDTTNAVRCMTVHAAKGLQFPVVILPDLFRKTRASGGKWQFTREDGIAFKLKNPDHPLGEREETERYKEIHSRDRESSNAEAKRLLYVAMTRARDRLVLPTHIEMKNAGSWHEWLCPVVKKFSEDKQMEVSSPLDKPAYDRKRREKTQGSGVISNMDGRTFEAPDDGMKIFTVSQLECYYRCPQEYYLKYVLGLPANEIFKEGGEKLPANVFGSIVHSILEGYGSSAKSALDDIIRTACISNGVIPDKTITRTVRRTIDAFDRHPLAKGLDKGSRELRFDWRMNNTTITGSIDWLKPAKDGFEIIDFKTDHIESRQIAERAKEYDLQMLCYALAAEEATGKNVDATTLVFLIPNESHSVKMTSERRGEGEAIISRIIDSINKKDYEIGDVKPPCFRCAFKHNRMCWKIH